MDHIYVVLSKGEVDSAYRDESAANNRIVELCRFSFEDVLYDALGQAYSDTASVNKCDLI